MRKTVKWFIFPLMLLLFLFPQTVMAASTQTASTPTVLINTYTFNKRVIVEGESATMTIQTNAEANNVWVKCDGIIKNATHISTNLVGQKEWTVTITPSKTQLVFVYASTSSSTINAVVRARNIRVNPIQVKIESLTINKEVLTEGETATMSIKTNDKVNYVWAFLDNKYVLASLTSTDPTGSKNWTLPVTPLVTQTITVSANTAYAVNGMVSSVQAVTVNKASVEITSLSADAIDIALGESIEVAIRTNTEANYVWVECDGKLKSARLDSTRTSSKTWYVTVAPTKDQRITAYASWDDNEANAVSRTLQVYVSDYYVRIYNLEPASISAAAGETRTITLYTNYSANYVWTTINGSTVNFTNTYADSYYDEKRWTYTTAPLAQTETITIHASQYSYNSSSDASTTLRITLTSELPSIYLTPNVAYASPNGSVTFTATTNLAVDRVEVRGLSQSQYTVSRGNAYNGQYYWTILIHSVEGTPGHTQPAYYIDAYDSTYSSSDYDMLYIIIQ